MNEWMVSPESVESCREVPSRVVEGSGGLLGFCWAGQRVGSVEGDRCQWHWPVFVRLKDSQRDWDGPDGARVVEARMCQGPPVGARPWMTANRRVVHNASKPPPPPVALRVLTGHRLPTTENGGGVRWRRMGGGSVAGGQRLGACLVVRNHRERVL